MAVDEKYAGIILKRVSDSQNSSEQIELISGKDNQRIPIHRVILTAASKYFAASLGPNFKEGQHNELVLIDTDYETLKTIVDYCYTGRIELTEANVETFLTIASSVQLDLLEEKCCLFYAEILTVDNSVGAFIFADKFSYVNLRQTAMDFICKKFKMVPVVEIQKLDHRLLQELLKCDELTSSEELIFERLVQWSHNGTREPYMPFLLRLIRLEHISFEFMNGTIEMVYREFQCSELVNAEYKRRASNLHLDSGFRKRRSLFCLFTKYEEPGGPEYSAIKIGEFNIDHSSWEEAAEIALGERIRFAVILDQNKVYALGGSLSGVYLNAVSSFDLNSRQEEILPPMNVSRRNFTPLLFGTYIYVFGGFNESGQLNSCERFDTKSKTWLEMKPMNVARSFVSVAILNGCIYAAGGEIVQGTYTQKFESYDPRNNVWTPLAPMAHSRCSFALIPFNGFLYAIGSQPVIEKYNPLNNKWTQIESLNEGNRITSGINHNGEIFGMRSDGRLGKIIIDANDNCSFVSLHETEQNSHYARRHFLNQN